MLTGQLIISLLFGDRSRAVEPVENAAGRRYNCGNPWRATRNVNNQSTASQAARRGIGFISIYMLKELLAIILWPIYLAK